jgi:hypothetical protein
VARVTFVKKAQQRYVMVPQIDPATGLPLRLATDRKDKHNRTVYRTVTVADKTQPLPPEECGKCRKPINVGDPYKHITPRSGPYGGRRMVRCGTCPAWHRWEYSSSLSARIEQIQWQFEQDVSNAESADDFSSAATNTAESIRELAGEKRDASDSLESGFGHATSQSDELGEQADLLESWADEIESTDYTDPEPEEEECDECGGSGKDGDVECSQCEGTGSFTPDEPSDDTLGSWQDEMLSNSGIDNCPV